MADNASQSINNPLASGGLERPPDPRPVVLSSGHFHLWHQSKLGLDPLLNRLLQGAPKEPGQIAKTCKVVIMYSEPVPCLDQLPAQASGNTVRFLCYQ